MEFLKIIKRRRTFFSEVVYIALNICLALALLIIMRATGSLALAFGLVLLSQWRVLAVRIRFWSANIQANLVSLIVSLSYVIFLYNINYSGLDNIKIILVQLLLAAAYSCWLLFLKPRSKRVYVMMQANLALFVGIVSIFTMSYGWPSSIVVGLVWLVGYATARHVLGCYAEPNLAQLSLAWGFVIAEIGWLAYHWTIAYRLPIIESVLVPQVAIIMLSIGFLNYKLYDSYFHNQKIRVSDVIMPLLFAVGLSLVLLLAFNGISTDI